MIIGEKGVAPEHREDASHLSDGPDLVSDHLLSDSGSSAWETKQREQQTGQTTCNSASVSVQQYVMNRLPKRDGTGAEIQLLVPTQTFPSTTSRVPLLRLPRAALITFGANERRFITGRSAVFNPQLAGWRLVCPRRKLQKHPSCLPDHGHYPTLLNTLSMTFGGGGGQRAGKRGTKTGSG